MIPLTNKQIEPIPHRTTCCCFNLYRLAKCVSLHGVISTLLLPLTVQVIGGQYGVLIFPNKKFHSTKITHEELLTFTNVPAAVEAIPITLLFLVHLLGFISVLKRWGGYILLYFLARLVEMFIILFWSISVGEDRIKSHVMSQYLLRWCCVFSLLIAFISINVIFAMAQGAIKNKKP